MALPTEYRNYLNELLKEVGQLEQKASEAATPGLVRRGVYGSPVAEKTYSDIRDKYSETRSRLTAETLKDLLDKEEAEKSKEKWWGKEVGEQRRKEQFQSEEADKQRRWAEALQKRAEKKAKRQAIMGAVTNLGLSVATGGIGGAAGLLGAGIGAGRGMALGALSGTQGIGMVSAYNAIQPPAAAAPQTSSSNWMSSLLNNQSWNPGYQNYGGSLSAYNTNGNLPMGVNERLSIQNQDLLGLLG